MAQSGVDSVLSRVLILAFVTLTTTLAIVGCNRSAAPKATGDSQGSSAEAEPKATGPVLGKIDEKNFTLEMQSSGPYKAGEEGHVEVVLVPKGPFHCNNEYPYKLKLDEAPTGVAYPTPVVKKDAIRVSPEKAVMSVPFVAKNAGEAKLSGTFYFSVCTSEQCVIDKREIAVLAKVD